MSEIPALSQRDFEPRIGEVFRVALDDGTSLEFVLNEVAPKGDPAPAGDRPCAFSLVFHGPLDRDLPQQIYQLENGSLGTVPIFLVPIGPSGDRMQFEAIFA